MGFGFGELAFEAHFDEGAVAADGDVLFLCGGDVAGVGVGGL